MADEVEMTPVAGAEPPKVNPLPTIRKPVIGGAQAPGLKPGLKLPPKPGATLVLKPGLKLPPKPGATMALKPGVKLPPRPVIHKPGATVAAAPLPKPVTPPVAAAAPAPNATPSPAPVEKPVSVDAQGVAKLPTVSATAVSRDDVKPVQPEAQKPMDALKSITQKLKGLTHEIPQQAILHKTGIIAESAISAAQKEAAKHKTARISLSDAMGVAPVKDEAAPMKTIRIKRPVAIPSAPVTEAALATAEGEEAKAAAPAPTMTQRKTLKIARPGGATVRPGGKFGIKRPGATAPAAHATPAAPVTETAAANVADGEIADIPDIPNIPNLPPPPPVAAPIEEGPAWLWSLSTLVQLAACLVLGALAWFLYQNTVTAYF